MKTKKQYLVWNPKQLNKKLGVLIWGRENRGINILEYNTSDSNVQR